MRTYVRHARPLARRDGRIRPGPHAAWPACRPRDARHVVCALASYLKTELLRLKYSRALLDPQLGKLLQSFFKGVAFSDRVRGIMSYSNCDVAWNNSKTTCIDILLLVFAKWATFSIFFNINAEYCRDVVHLKQYHHASFIFAKVNTNLTIYTYCMFFDN